MSPETLPKKEIAAVKGTKDILPGEVEVWQEVESQAKALFELYGYRELRAPVIEPTELYEKGTGETTDIVTKEMYTFIDKAGRSITLRPEYTPSVTRAIVEHRLDLLGTPMRYYYIGPMFRYDKPQKGRYRQFHQVDIEVFGEKDPAIDAEVVQVADSLLRRLGVEGTETLVNSVGCRACRPAYGRDLKARAESVRERLCPDCRRKVETNPLRIFDCKVEGCRAEAREFPKITAYLCPECRDHDARFRDYLGLLGVAFRPAPDMVRGLDYYTRTIFEVVTKGGGQQNAVLGGGRYDDMMKDFGGPDLCGIGFALGVERLIALLGFKPKPRKFVYLIHVGEEAKKAALVMARFLRDNGVEALLEFGRGSFKSQFARANKLGAGWALMIGEDEVRGGVVKVKEMATGEQTSGTADEVLAVIQEKR